MSNRPPGEIRAQLLQEQRKKLLYQIQLDKNALEQRYQFGEITLSEYRMRMEDYDQKTHNLTADLTDDDEGLVHQDVFQEAETGSQTKPVIFKPSFIQGEYGEVDPARGPNAVSRMFASVLESVHKILP